MKQTGVGVSLLNGACKRFAKTGHKVRREKARPRHLLMFYHLRFINSHRIVLVLAWLESLVLMAVLFSEKTIQGKLVVNFTHMATLYPFLSFDSA